MLGGVNWKQVRPHRMHNAQNVKKRTIAIDVSGLSVGHNRKPCKMAESIKTTFGGSCFTDTHLHLCEKAV